MARKTTTPAKRTPKRVSNSQSASGSSLLRKVLLLIKLAILIPTSLIIAMRWVAPPTTMFMMIRHVERILESTPGPPILYSWVPLSTISPNMPLAVVASEDQHFSKHWGFDLEAISQAVEYNRTHAKTRGASTISQQVAKNLFLWPGRSYVRKAFEAGLTVLIELCWSKRRILEVYLNTAEFGNGTYGVKAASWRFFGKSPDRLSQHEAALLAAVLPSPRKLSPQRPTPFLLYRARWIQQQMQHLGPHYLELR